MLVTTSMPSWMCGHAGGQELVAALDLHQAEAAGAHRAQALQMAEGGNVDLVLPRHFEDGLAGARARLPGRR